MQVSSLTLQTENVLTGAYLEIKADDLTIVTPILDEEGQRAMAAQLLCAALYMLSDTHADFMRLRDTMIELGL